MKYFLNPLQRLRDTNGHGMATRTCLSIPAACHLDFY